jgi:glycosyltransferase involved in cell wall biosynthesis
MLRILHLITTMPVGGAENLVLTTMRHLDPTRFSSVLCCIQDKGILGNEAENSGFQVVALDRMKRKHFDFQAITDIVEVIRREQADVIHCHLYHAALYGRLAAKRAGVPCVVTAHNVYSNPKWHRRLINRWLGRYTARIIGVSQPVGDDVLRYDRIAPEKLLVIPNGIDLAPMLQMLDHETAKKRLGLPACAPVIGCVGRLEPQKGHRFLLEALAMLRKQRGDCPHLVIVGTGSALGSIRRQIESLSLEDRVHLLGTRRDIPEILAALDLFVLPSLWEGLPLALLEAMAAGVPVMASAVGGVGDVLDNGRYGGLLPPGNGSALCDAMTDWLDHPEKRRALGELGKMRAHQDYSARSMVGRLEEIYEALRASRKRDSNRSAGIGWLNR